jgi:hypothetical protein
MRPVSTMATSSKILLSPSQEPVFYLPGIGSETAELTSELLQENHEKHHIFFNYAGFHVRPFLAKRPHVIANLTLESYRSPPAHSLRP